MIGEFDFTPVRPISRQIQVGHKYSTNLLYVPQNSSCPWKYKLPLNTVLRVLLLYVGQGLEAQQTPTQYCVEGVLLLYVGQGLEAQTPTQYCVEGVLLLYVGQGLEAQTPTQYCVEGVASSCSTSGEIMF